MITVATTFTNSYIHLAKFLTKISFVFLHAVCVFESLKSELYQFL